MASVDWKDDAMGVSDNRSRSFGSSSSTTLWSESWENSNAGRKQGSYLFEKRTGIEVIEWQNLDNGKMRKKKLSRGAQQKRLYTKIVIIAATVAALVGVGIYFGLSKSNDARNENVIESQKETIDSMTYWDRIERNNTVYPGKEKDIGADNIFSNNSKPNATSPQTSEQNNLHLTNDKTSTSVHPTTGQARETVVLHPNESLNAGQFRYSPNGRFKVGLTEDNGDLVLMEVHQSVERVMWAASRDSGSNWVSSSNPLCFLQTDGNLVLRDAQTRTTIWMTRTHGNSQALLVLDDSGRIAIRSSNDSRTVLWMEGVPRQQYVGPSSDNMVFPIRGAFYYPWYPSTWHVNGHRAHYNTSLGFYSSSDPEVAEAHIEAMDYGKIQLSIASWWGPGTHLDRSRLTMLLDETVAQNSPLKWTIYHEDERDYNPTPEELSEDFDYLKKWFAWHEAWAHIDDKPVIFVYNEAGCDVASRWMEASRGEWYVVLKLFSGFEDCPDQPDSWHQYGVGKEDGVVHNPGYSFVLSPGFWRADTEISYLERVNQTQFCQNSQWMVESGERWQLIVSFNEAGEGTLIEPSPDWDSDSGYGDYLDCLHVFSLHSS